MKVKFIFIAMLSLALSAFGMSSIVDDSWVREFSINQSGTWSHYVAARFFIFPNLGYSMIRNNCRFYIDVPSGKTAKVTVTPTGSDAIDEQAILNVKNKSGVRTKLNVAEGLSYVESFDSDTEIVAFVTTVYSGMDVTINYNIRVEYFGSSADEKPEYTPEKPESTPEEDVESGSGDSPLNGYLLFNELEGVVPTDAASVYDGYIYDEQKGVVGTLQAKVSKPKNGKSSVSVSYQLVGEKKVSVKGDLYIYNGLFSERTKDGREISIIFCEYGMIGLVDSDYIIEGGRNLFMSKNKVEKEVANEILDVWLGSVNVLIQDQTFNIKVGKNGKTTIKGTYNGVKVSATTQALIGDYKVYIPVVYSKGGLNLAFGVWLPQDGSDGWIDEFNNCVVGKAGLLQADATFNIYKNIEEDYPSVVSEIDGYYILPGTESITQSGNKWIVDNGITPAKISCKNGILAIAPGKKDGDVYNPASLKLSYKANDGTFTGSFYIYTFENNKLKKIKVSVSGVLIGDVGYGTATVGKSSSWPITIE